MLYFVFLLVKISFNEFCHISEKDPIEILIEIVLNIWINFGKVYSFILLIWFPPWCMPIEKLISCFSDSPPPKCPSHYPTHPPGPYLPSQVLAQSPSHVRDGELMDTAGIHLLWPIHLMRENPPVLLRSLQTWPNRGCKMPAISLYYSQGSFHLYTHL